MAGWGWRALFSGSPLWRASGSSVVAPADRSAQALQTPWRSLLAAPPFSKMFLPQMRQCQPRAIARLSFRLTLSVQQNASAKLGGDEHQVWSLSQAGRADSALREWVFEYNRKSVKGEAPSHFCFSLLSMAIGWGKDGERTIKEGRET